MVYKGHDIMGELIKALYRHHVNEPIHEGDLWVVANWARPNYFVGVDRNDYYLINDKRRPNRFVIPFDLFIRDEYGI